MNTTPFRLLLRRRWWLVLVGLIPTLLIAVAGTGGQTPVYESTSTFVVRPVQQDPERVMRAMDTLLRGVEIHTTYASVVGSRSVEDRALERLDLSEDQREELGASGKVITGTTILEIRATASDPEVASAFAGAVAAEALAFINDLENGFGLVPLDAPSDPRPAGGTRPSFTLAVSGMLGLVLGLGLVLASGQLVPLGGRRPFDIVEPVTGASTEAYLLARLREEKARIDRSTGALTVLLLVPVRPDRFAWLRPHLLSTLGPRSAAAVLRTHLEEGDVLAYLGGGKFAVLAVDRIAHDLARLCVVHPALAFSVGEVTYVGGSDAAEEPLDDLPTLLQRMEEDLARAPDPTPIRRNEPTVSMWSDRR